jgi:hypothetical protein
MPLPARRTAAADAGGKGVSRTRGRAQAARDRQAARGDRGKGEAVARVWRRQPPEDPSQRTRRTRRSPPVRPRPRTSRRRRRRPLLAAAAAHVAARSSCSANRLLLRERRLQGHPLCARPPACSPALPAASPAVPGRRGRALADGNLHLPRRQSVGEDGGQR